MLASSIALGGIAGLLLRGDWRNLRQFRPHWWQVAALALLTRGLGVVFGLPVAVHTAAITVVAVVALRNWRLPGALLVALGSTLNVLVIVANGGMPFDATAATSVGAQVLANDALHHPLRPDSRLPWLADVLPVAMFRNVYSLGDVFIAAGGFWIPFSVLRRR